MIEHGFRRFAALWRYRSFVRSSILNDVRTRFSRSAIGGFWMLLQPLAQSAIFALILSVVLKARLPGIDDTHAYAAYLLSGMLCWTLFMESVGKGINLFVENAGLIKKINFPLLTLPIIAAGIALVNNLFLLLSTLAILALLGFFPVGKVVWLLPLTCLTLFLGFTIGLVLGIFNVFMRDIGIITPIILQFLFWFCPIVYSPASMPALFHKIVMFNPVSGLVQAYQGILVFDSMPSPDWLWPSAALVLLCVWLLRFLLRRTFAQMVDIL